MKPATLGPLEVLHLYRTHNGTLDDLVASRADADPDRTIIVYKGRSWTWRGLQDASCRLAAGLARLGVGVGDRFIVMGHNSPWHVFGLVAATKLGAIMVPINPDFKVAETSYVFGHSKPSAILCDELARSTAEQARTEANLAIPIETLDDKLIDGVESWPQSTNSDPELPCVIVYTSGTTGFPKGALHSQSNLIAAGEAFIERLHLQPWDRLLIILPMFHINALFYSVAGTLAAGATMLIQPRFSASTFWRTVADLGATQTNIIEAVGTILLNRPSEEFVEGHSLTKVYGVRQSMMDGFRNRFGVPHLVGGYAMTEIPAVINTPFEGPSKPGSMGLLCRHPDPARPWAQCRVVDSESQDTPDGEVGELIVHTPIVMKGYFRDPEQTAEVFRNGWFYTGDLVRRDADGFYFFVSRKRDIIRRRGENIAGSELDRVVGEHPGVAAVAAIGVPSEFGDEDILVAVTPIANVAVSEGDIHSWCREKLSPAKTPRYIIFLDQLPYTPTHKVAKSALRSDATLRARAKDFGSFR